MNPETVERMVSYHAHRFADTTGIDVEDLMQEGRIAANRAIERRNTSYDPSKASMKTYANRAIHNRMCDLAKRASKRVSTVPLKSNDDGEVLEPADDGPTPERVSIFVDLVRQLPEDARTVVALVLEEASPVDRIGDVARVVSERFGWSADRAQLAIASIGNALSRGGVCRRAAVA